MFTAFGDENATSVLLNFIGGCISSLFMSMNKIQQVLLLS